MFLMFFICKLMFLTYVFYIYYIGLHLHSTLLGNQNPKDDYMHCVQIM